MKEDINILEDSIRKYEEHKSNMYDINLEKLMKRLILDEKGVQALQNLLTRYKQLEQDNNNFKAAALKNDDYYKEVCNKNKELEEENKKLDEKFKYAVLDNIVEENYIPKSLIKEKIEKFKKMLQKTMGGELQKYTPSEIIFIIRFLEELLGDEK